MDDGVSEVVVLENQITVLAFLPGKIRQWGLDVCRVHPMNLQSSLPEVNYSGRGEQLARAVADVVQGGQVVLTEAAWVHIQDQLPGQAQVSLMSASS